MEEPTCQICFFEYSKERPTSTLLPCNHRLCMECLKLSVLKKCICPFCKQSVGHCLTGNDVQGIDELQQQFPNDEGEDNQFHLLDSSFLQEDMSILLQRLKACYQRLRQIVSQKDYEFDTKWSIYDKVELEVLKLQKALTAPHDASVLCHKIHSLSNDLEELKSGRWGSSLLTKYKAGPSNLPGPDFLSATFFITKKKGKGKRK